MAQDKQAHRTPELDGIRGIAILMVLFFHILKRADDLTNSDLLHALTSPMRIGWAGVDIFFVLSGFLITSILLSAKARPHYYKNFYVRRVLRIFPLYFVFILAAFIFLPQLDPAQGARTQALWPFFVIYQQNWLFISKPQPSAILSVTWSLAIEEQFYLVWPAIVKFFNKRQMAFICAGIVFFSLMTRITMLSFPIKDFPNEEFFYYGTLTRFEGLAAGALVAIIFQSSAWKHRLGKVAMPGFILALLGFGAILFGSSLSPMSDNPALTIWGYTLLAMIGVTLILLASTQPENSWVRVALRNRVLSFFGKYSYAIYLLHLPIVLAFWVYFTSAHRRSGEVWLLFILVTFSLTMIASLLSWHLLEKHALRLKEYFE